LTQRSATPTLFLTALDASRRELLDRLEHNPTVSTPSTPLPEFELPPVVEVALGIQFDPIPQLDSAQIIELWADDLRARFPHVQELQPITPAVEWFGAPSPIPFAIHFGGKGLQTRWLFSSPGQNQLVQIQQDRFVRNWRKIGEGETYPRYPQIKQGFQEDFERLSTFLSKKALGALVPNQCEVTYVNQIDLASEAAPGSPSTHLAPWSGKHSDAFLQGPESVEIAAHYVIERDGQSVGRLHVTNGPAQAVKTGATVSLLTLTARGRPAAKTLASALDFFDLGREYVVRGFASITSPEAHAKWRRRDGNSA
jgi:uncharacterized protein (TIGR04255 family)